MAYNHTYGTTTDIAVMTRSAIMRGFIDQVLVESPVLAIMVDNNMATMEGGESLDVPVKNARGTANYQTYFEGDVLTTGRTNRYDTARFDYGNAQVPVTYTVKDLVENRNGNRDAKILDIIERMTKDAHTEMRDGLSADMWDENDAEGDRGFRSIPLALDHSRTYGNITSDTSSVAYWNGASISGAYTDRNTAYTASIDTIRKAYDAASRYDGNIRKKKYIVVPTTLFRAFKRQAESKDRNIVNGSLAKYGHTSIMIDDMEVVEDKYLEYTKAKTTWMFILDPETWHFEVDPVRKFWMTPFLHQGNIVGGKDEYLARIFLSARLYCDRPQANIWLSNVS